MTFDNSFLRKAFLMGAVLLCATLMADLMGRAKLALILSGQDGAADIAQLKSYGLFVRLGFLALFFMAYRRNHLNKVLFAATEMMLLVSVLVLFFGVHDAPGWLHKAYFLGAEAWSSFFMAFLFWAFANQSFSMGEASTVYPFMLFVPLTISKPIVSFFASRVDGPNLEATMEGYGAALLVVNILFTCAFYAACAYKFGDLPPCEEEKPILSKAQEWRYLGWLFAIIASFSVCARTMEVLFRVFTASYAKTPGSYLPFMETYTTYLSMGGVVLFALTFWMVRVLGWMKSALVAPLFVLVATAVIYTWAHQSPAEAGHAATLQHLLLTLTVLLKGLGVLYLTTKEMAYIPLRATTRVYAKGTVEFLGLGVYTLVATTLFERVGMGEGYQYPIMLLLVASTMWCVAVVKISQMMQK